MAGRIRTIKPELLEDDATASLTDTEWRVFVSLLLLADDYGNFRANPKQLDGAIFWASDADRDWTSIRSGLAKLVLFWEEDGQLYGHIRGWSKHQRVDRPGKPRCPGPPHHLLDAPPTSAAMATATEPEERPSMTQIRETLARPSRDSRETHAGSSRLTSDLRPLTSDHRSPTSDRVGADRVSGPIAPEDDPLVKLLESAVVFAGEDVRRIVGAARLLAADRDDDIFEIADFACNAVVRAVGTSGIETGKVGKYFLSTVESLLADGGLEAARDKRAPRSAKTTTKGSPAEFDLEADRASRRGARIVLVGGGDS